MIEASTDRSWWFHTTLDPQLSFGAQRAWHRRLHRRIGAGGLAVSTHWAVSVVLGVSRPLGIAERNALVSWLIDEPEVWAIQLGEMTLLEDALARGIPIVPVADLWRAAGLPRSRLDVFSQDTLQAITRGAVCDRLVKRARWQMASP